MSFICELCCQHSASDFLHWKIDKKNEASILGRVKKEDRSVNEVL